MVDKAGAAADRAARELARIERALIEQIKKLTAKLDTKQGELVSDKEARANASKIRGQIVRAMEEQGLQSIAKEADKAAIEAAEAVAKEIDFGEFNPDVAREIEQIINGQMQEVADTFAKGADEIGEAIRIGIANGDGMQSLIDDVAQKVGATFAQAQSAVDSAIMGVSRKVRLTDAEEMQSAGGPVVMVYVGPDDKKTRPFCEQYVGKGVYLDDIDKLDNDTELPADIFGGGYNCRHSWVSFTEDLAKSRGIEIVEV